jgi:hypothetical protein
LSYIKTAYSSCTKHGLQADDDDDDDDDEHEEEEEEEEDC